jgi:thiamine-phosphate pyrophosphorylase
MRVSGFYGVVDLPPAPDAVLRATRLATALIAGGATILQVRMKRATPREFCKVAQEVRELTRSAGILLVVNDRLDVALAVGAEAVHLGQDDLPLSAARAAIRAAGRVLAIGISTHTPAQAAECARAGADYLGFGPVYATSTKENPDPVQGVGALADAVRAAGSTPVVAIGGITRARVPEVMAAGASAACVISAVNHAPDIVQAAREVASAFAARANR